MGASEHRAPSVLECHNCGVSKSVWQNAADIRLAWDTRHRRGLARCRRVPHPRAKDPGALPSIHERCDASSRISVPETGQRPTNRSKLCKTRIACFFSLLSSSNLQPQFLTQKSQPICKPIDSPRKRLDRRMTPCALVVQKDRML